eukprot:765281-Hanusia_phi.AAC.6
MTVQASHKLLEQYRRISSGLQKGLIAPSTTRNPSESTQAVTEDLRARETTQSPTARWEGASTRST